MNLAVAGLDRLRFGFGAKSIIVCHHEGWHQQRLRGSIALFGALDAQIHVKRDQGVNYYRIEELRDGAIPDKNVMAFVVEDSALKPVEAINPKVAGLKDRERKLFEVVTNACSNGTAQIKWSTLQEIVHYQD
jgi:hypothetical protein